MHSPIHPFVQLLVCLHLFLPFPLPPVWVGPMLTSEELYDLTIIGQLTSADRIQRSSVSRLFCQHLLSYWTGRQAQPGYWVELNDKGVSLVPGALTWALGAVCFSLVLGSLA